MVMTLQVAGLIVVELRSRVYEVNACVHLPKPMCVIGPIYSGYVSFLPQSRELKIPFLSSFLLAQKRFSEKLRLHVLSATSAKEVPTVFKLGSLVQ